MAPTPAFHEMIEVIDLTLSDDDSGRDVKVEPLYKVLPSLPLRERCANIGPNPCSLLSKSLGKRRRGDTPDPQLGVQVRTKRQRQSLQTHQRYPCGVVKSVRLAGCVRRDDVTLPELLQVHQLDEALLCSYQWDISWLMDEVGMASVKTTCVGDWRCRIAHDNTPWPYQDIVYPSQPTRQGSVHGKLMLLFRKDGLLRIAVPTGNLRRQEWGMGRDQTLDNAVFILDLPLLTEKDDAELQWDNHFRTSLLDYLLSLGLSAELRARVHQHNFDKAAPFAFVFTGGPRSSTCGFSSLRSAVVDLGLAAPLTSKLRVDYQASSIGRLSRAFADKLISAIRGHSTVQDNKTEDELRIIYPSRTMALLAPNRVRANDIHRTKPRSGSCYYDILDKGLRDIELGTHLSHAKIMRVRLVGRVADSEAEPDPSCNWLYIGSHNLSIPAWSKSYECGVVLRGDGESGDPNGVFQVRLHLDGPKYPVSSMWDN